MSRKLNEKQVAEIRTLIRTMSYREIGERYGVTCHAIASIKLGKNWNKKDPPIHRNIVLIHDPAKEGAFSKGAIFSYTELECMLKDSSFTPGTKIMVKQDQRELKAGNYIINGKEMVRCDD